MWHVTRKSSISSLCPLQKEKKTQPVSPFTRTFFFGDIWHLFQRGRNSPLTTLFKTEKEVWQFVICAKEIFRSFQRETNSHWKDRNWRVALWEVIYCRRGTTRARSFWTSSESRKVRARFFFPPLFRFSIASVSFNSRVRASLVSFWVVYWHKFRELRAGLLNYST